MQPTGEGCTEDRTHLSAEVEEFPEVLDSLGGENVLSWQRETTVSSRRSARRSRTGSDTHVVVLPAELSGNESLGGKRLASLDNVQVLDVQFKMLGGVTVDEDQLVSSRFSC